MLSNDRETVQGLNLVFRGVHMCCQNFEKRSCAQTALELQRAPTRAVMKFRGSADTKSEGAPGRRTRW